GSGAPARSLPEHTARCTPWGRACTPGGATGPGPPPRGGAGAAIRGQCPAEIRALPHATAMAKPAVGLPPEPKHSSWRVWTPVTLTLTVFGLRTLTVKVRRVRPSPTSTMPAWKWGGNLAASPIVAWNRRAFRFSLYAGKAVGSPTLQYNEMLLG